MLVLICFLGGEGGGGEREKRKEEKTRPGHQGKGKFLQFISDINTLQTWFRTRDVRCFIVLLFFEILGTLGLEYVRDMVL